MQQQIDEVVEHLNTMVSIDGGSVELAGQTSDTISIRYAPGSNEDCPACVLEPESLAMWVQEALRSRTGRQYDVRLDETSDIS